MNSDELRRKLGLPKAGKVIEISAEEYAKAGDAKTALRLREGLAAKAKRDAALKRSHVDRCEIRLIGRVVTMNQYARNRGSRIRGVEHGKDLTRQAWERAGKPVIAGKFKLSKLIVYVSDRKTDASNEYIGAIKVMLDGLKDCGCIQNDTKKFHVGPDFKDGGIEWPWPCDHDGLWLTLEKVAPSGAF